MSKPEKPATKQAFLDRLASCLAALEADDRTNTVEFYSEQIDDRIDDGMSEAQAVASLEAPEDIAANILAMKAEAAEKAAEPQAGGGAGANPPTSRPRSGCLKKTLLAGLAVVGAVILLPIACGVACVLVAAYAALWMGVAALAALSLAGAVFCVVATAGCIVDPVADAAVVLANVAAIVGAAGLALLLALAAFGLGKLLVKLVIWAVRGIRRLVRGKTTAADARPTAPNACTVGDPATPQSAAADAAAAPQPAYPSMPLPPLATAGQTVKRPRRRFPAWGAAALTGALLVVAAGCTGLGGILAAGGIDALAERAGVSRFVAEGSYATGQVDAIDLTLQGQLCEPLTIYLGVSPDKDIHVTATAPQACMAAWCGAQQAVEVRQTGTRMELFPTSTPAAGVQNFLTALATMLRADIEPNSVTVLLPSGWDGTLTCDDPSAQIETAWNFAQDALRVDGAVDLHAGYVNLYQVDAAELSLDADCIYLSYVRADHLRVNADRAKSGYACLMRVQADSAELGGRRVEYENFDAVRLEANTGTDLRSYDDPGDVERAVDYG